MEISPEKSKVVNLRKQRSEFLGFTFTVNAKNGRFVAHSRMSEKARKQAHNKLKQAVKEIAKKQSATSVWRYNMTVMGIHNYYEVATHINVDFDHLSKHLTESMYNRLRRDWKRANKSEMSATLLKRYGRYNPKWYKAHDVVIILIYAWKHKYEIQFIRTICPYTKEGRLLTHDNLKAVNREVLRHVQRSYCSYRSVEYNDNRISKFVAQYGKCAVTGMKLGLLDWGCHHKVPLHSGGADGFDNLVIILNEVHTAIHSETTEQLQLLYEKYQLSDEKKRLCKKLYGLAHSIKG